MIDLIMESPTNTTSKKKVLVIGNRLLGDTVDSLPALTSIVEAWKECDFFLLGSDYVNDIYQSFGLHLNIIKANFNHRQWGQFFFKQFFNKLHLIKDLEFDVGIALPGGFEHGLLLKLANIPIRIGSRTDARSFLLTHSYSANKNSPNHKIFEEMLKSLKITPRLPTYVNQPKLLEKLQKNIDSFPSPPDSYYVISAKSTEARREWPLKYFEQFILDFKKNNSLKAVLLGTDKEKEAIEELSRCTDSLSFAGKTSLQEVCEVINNAQFFLGNDSGLAHVAGMLNKPTFVLYGPSDYLVANPPGHRVIQIIARLDEGISPENRMLKKHWQKVKMENISPEEVVNIVLKNLKSYTDFSKVSNTKSSIF